MAVANSTVLVKVTKYADRDAWIMYYDDVLTGRRVTRSTKQTTEREASKVAAKWESELETGQYKPKANITWADFREQFLAAKDRDYSEKGYAAFISALNAVERHLKVDRLAQLTTARINHVVKLLREVDEVSDETIRSYLGHLRAALNWAERVGLLREVPVIDMPKRAKGGKRMKGRPITAEEFERMLDKVEAGLVLSKTSRLAKPTEVAADRLKQLADDARKVAPGWRTFITALWWSGLRLGEAITLSWDDERFITVDLSGKVPRLFIAAGQDKSQEARLPLAPEFADMLLAVPKARRTGPVFPLVAMDGESVSDLDYVSRVISCIGEAAGVVVDKASGKFASAHDFRRAFGVRWASRPITSRDLMALMRHADISTTMKYYVGHDVSATESAIYTAVAATRQTASVNA